MSVFDTVHIRCPVCDARIEEQSKAGSRILASYTIGTAPRAIIKDLAGRRIACECGADLIIKTKVRLSAWVEVYEGT